MKNRLMAALLASATLAVSLVQSSPAVHAMPVFDSANYSQNLLTAARTLQQINQQIQSLQNEARMLEGMEMNLSRIDFPELDRLREKLGAIDRLMGQAQGVDFRVDQLDERYRQYFPSDFDRLVKRDRRVAAARERLDNEMAAFRQTMGVQSQIVDNVRDDVQALGQIVAKSQGAQGSLQVAQATNQLLALTAKQQFQIQNLMAAQFRSQSLEAARRGQSAREARERTKRFLGDGKAYTPHP